MIATASQLQAPQDLPVRLTDSNHIHEENITIHVKAFERSGRTFYDCSAESQQCCLAGFTEDEVVEFVQGECDKIFEKHGWIYTGLKRLPPPADPSCQQWQSRGLPGEPSGHQDTRDTTRTYEPNHDQAKQRRLDKQPGPQSDTSAAHGASPSPDIPPTRCASPRTSAQPNSALPGPLPDTADDSVTLFAQEYVGKVIRGLKRLLKTREKLEQVTGFNLGECLSELRQAEDEDLEKLENVLTVYQSQSASGKFLAEFYTQYAVIRRRFLDPKHSETGDKQKELGLMRKESMWEVTSAVVNRLVPYWGVCASLIYNALTETKFKGSNLYRGVQGARGRGISADRLTKVIDAIVRLLLATDIQITIREATPVVNPAFFLTLVSRKAYVDVCKSVKLDSIADLDLQAKIDGLADELLGVQINAGQIPLSELLEKEVGTATKRTLEKKKKKGLLGIHFLPKDGNSEDPSHSIIEESRTTLERVAIHDRPRFTAVNVAAPGGAHPESGRPGKHQSNDDHSDDRLSESQLDDDQADDDHHPSSLPSLPQRHRRASNDTQLRSVSDLSSEHQSDGDHFDDPYDEAESYDEDESDDDLSEDDQSTSHNNGSSEDQSHENHCGHSSEDQFDEEIAEDRSHSGRESMLKQKASHRRVDSTETAAPEQPRKRQRRQDSRRTPHAEGSSLTLPSLATGSGAGVAYVQEALQYSAAEYAALPPQSERTARSRFDALVIAALSDNSLGSLDPRLLLGPSVSVTSVQSTSPAHALATAAEPQAITSLGHSPPFTLAPDYSVRDRLGSPAAEQRGDIGELLQPQLQFDAPNFGLGDDEQHSYFGEVMLSQPVDDFLGIPPDASEIGQFEHSSFDFVLQGTGIDPLFDMSFSSPESSL
ncbi:hypothetical protein QBC47DRAFT_385553 [Echria macrotheca]|uniref:Uncharacterized protein n=1 Tax=Echria macrotheca TaxID=438768 RepID=A0AAJ0BDW0_9PEZI|nr:hypothetical protein QBC47DRAFT_385553 [Echria macrotheca]